MELERHQCQEFDILCNWRVNRIPKQWWAQAPPYNKIVSLKFPRPILTGDSLNTDVAIPEDADAHDASVF